VSSLDALKPGTRAVVASLPPARGIAKRMISLGLTPGAEVRMLQNHGRGPIILEVHGARLAIGRGMARAVVIQALHPDSPVPVEGF
jgi:ferrous iron transport protein A